MASETSISSDSNSLPLVPDDVPAGTEPVPGAAAEFAYSEALPPIKLAITEYAVSPFTDEEQQAEVVYTDDAGLIYKRFVNIPRLDDGSVDQGYFEDILQSHLLSINIKTQVGVVVFKDHSEFVEETESQSPA